MRTKKGVHSFRIIILFGMGVLLLLSITWILTVTFRTPRYQVPKTTDWNTGDIFFSVGDSWKSVVVRAVTGVRRLEIPDSTPSHCGIIIKEGERIWLVHESTDKGKLVKESVEDYQKINGSYCIYSKVVPCMVDTISLIKAIDYWMMHGKGFDYNFEHSDSTTFYCTEFVVHAMERSGCNIFSDLRNNQYIYPKEIETICGE